MSKTNNIIFSRIVIIVLVLCIVQFFSNISYAVEHDEILKNQKYELIARKI